METNFSCLIYANNAFKKYLLPFLKSYNYTGPAIALKCGNVAWFVIVGCRLLIKNSNEMQCIRS